MILLSWNVAGRVARLPEQVERVLSVEADVVCLQELTLRSGELWRQELADHGYRGVELADPARPAAPWPCSPPPASPSTRWRSTTCPSPSGSSPSA